MADGRRVGEFPHQIIGDQRLPLHVVRDECLDMALQEIGGDGHCSLLVHLRVAVRLTALADMCARFLMTSV